MAKRTKQQINPQAVIDECHTLLDKVGIEPAEDWQKRGAKARSRLAFRVQLLADQKQPGWDLDEVIARLRALIEGENNDG